MSTPILVERSEFEGNGEGKAMEKSEYPAIQIWSLEIIGIE